jgi:hypothetical protein
MSMHTYNDVWEALEDAQPHVAATADLYHWSTNYDPGKGPMTLFLDLIGWSADELGMSLYEIGDASGLGYVELDKLGLALREYADRPLDVRSFVDVLMELESR